MILGCGRSGTSIFGELFDALPGFEYRSEPLLAEIPAPADGRRVAVKVPTAAPGTTPPPGCPVPMDQLWAAVPAPRVVFWQVRHPLDAVCSLRVGIDAGWRTIRGPLTGRTGSIARWSSGAPTTGRSSTVPASTTSRTWRWSAGSSR